MAIFGRKKRKGRLSDGDGSPAVPSKALPSRRVVSAPAQASTFASSSATSHAPADGSTAASNSFHRSLMPIPDDEVVPPVHQGPIDDFGRPIRRPVPALSNASLASRPASPDPGAPRYGVGDEEDDPSALIELQLLYGYSPMYPALELSVSQVADICELCCHYLTLRGLDTPLLLSSMALDLEIEGPSSLARSYVKNRPAYDDEVALASPLSLAAHLKWALARLVPPAGQPDRGFVSYKDYETFRSTEQGAFRSSSHRGPRG